MTIPTLILGIDPGLTKANPCGLALVDLAANPPALIWHSEIPPVAMKNWQANVCNIATMLAQVLAARQPHAVAVEGAHLGDNPQSGLKLACAVGAVLAVAALHQVPCIVVQPAESKQALTGTHLADKAMMQLAVRQQFGVLIGPHCADAVGHALAGAVTLRERAWLEVMKK